MATLIKLRIAPQKHLLKKSLATIPVNSLLSLENQRQRRQRISTVEDNMACVRAAIKKFRDQRETIKHPSFARGEERAEKQAITEILLAYAKFLSGLKDEAVTIEKLARRTAANITNRSDFALAEDSTVASAALFGIMRLFIKAPSTHFAVICEEIDKFSQKLNTRVEVEFTANNTAQLGFIVAAQNISLLVNAQGLLLTLKNVNNHLTLV